MYYWSDRSLANLSSKSIFILAYYPKLLEVYYQTSNESKLIGCIREKPNFCSRKQLEVWIKDEQKMFDISGPCCPVSCGGEIPFQVDN